MQKIFVTRQLPGSALIKLSQQFDVEVYSKDLPIPKVELLEKARDVDGLLTLVTDLIDKEVLDNAPQLKIISNYAVGYNNINVEMCTQRGIMVTNTPGVLSETTADCAFALILCLARKINVADTFVRQGKFKGWMPNLFLGADVYGKTLGIIGMGRIGQAVARRAQGFNMDIQYYDINPLKGEIATGIAPKISVA